MYADTEKTRLSTDSYDNVLFFPERKRVKADGIGDEFGVYRRLHSYCLLLSLSRGKIHAADTQPEETARENAKMESTYYFLFGYPISREMGTWGKLF